MSGSTAKAVHDAPGCVAAAYPSISRSLPSKLADCHQHFQLLASILFITTCTIMDSALAFALGSYVYKVLKLGGTRKLSSVQLQLMHMIHEISLYSSVCSTHYVTANGFMPIETQKAA